MELSQRFQKHVVGDWTVIGSIFLSIIVLFIEIECVLSKEIIPSTTNVLMGFVIMLLLLVQLVALFYASVYALTWLYTCVQHFFQLEWAKPKARYSLNILSYRLFYASASRASLFAFGFFIGLYLQGQNLLHITEDTGNWKLLGLFLFGMVQGFILQFFLQSFVITLYYTLSFLLRNHAFRKKGPKRIKKHMHVLLKQATQPTNLILSLVAAPALFIIGLIVARSVGFDTTFDEATGLLVVFTLMVYSVSTLFRYRSAIYQKNQKTKE